VIAQYAYEDTSTFYVYTAVNACNINVGIQQIFIPQVFNIPAKFHRQHFLRGWSVNLLPDAYYIKHAKIHVYLTSSNLTSL